MLNEWHRREQGSFAAIGQESPSTALMLWPPPLRTEGISSTYEVRGVSQWEYRSSVYCHKLHTACTVTTVGDLW